LWRQKSGGQYGLRRDCPVAAAIVQRVQVLHAVGVGRILRRLLHDGRLRWWGIRWFGARLRPLAADADETAG
jgi:hypothetical protein